MGIPGILKEIGKGERVALSRLAIEHLERQRRPLRVAIDAAIWNFQTQAGQGGKNPALRTLFYRLLKLLALPIHPVFVYDGKNKPLTKRGRTVSRYGSCITNEVSKKLIQVFRFPCHVAPGEAEAECAMLQRKGLVDAVMSQDVDAIMFGSNLTLRDWSKEASKHNKTPTHVNVLDLPGIKRVSGLDPAGMILVALLSGGDYDEAGVAGIGSTLACEIAKAGFGTDLLDAVKKGDEGELQEWRERLQFELETNESGYFKVKRKSLKIPDTFPDRKILSYYTNPAVTPEEQLMALEKKWEQAWEAEIEIQALRDYVGESFEWLYKPGAWKFVRVMAPALLANRLQRRAATCDIESVEQITERRQHMTSDGIPELRITVVPAKVVGLDLDAEEDSPEYLERLVAEDNEDAAEVEIQEVDGNPPTSPSKRRKTPPWMPHNPEKMWVAEAIVEIGAREHVEMWRQIQREIEEDPRKFATRKCRKQNAGQKEKAGVSGMLPGALLNYLVPSKPSRERTALAVTSQGPASPLSKASTKAQGAPQTPKKSTSSQPPSLGSPNVMDFFQSTKIGPRPQSTEAAKSFNNHPLNCEFGGREPQRLGTRATEKEQRREDAGADIQRSQTISSFQLPPPTTSSHMGFQSQSRSGPARIPKTASTEGGSFEEPITLWSSPITAVEKADADEESSAIPSIPNTVTQRKRRKPVAKDTSLLGAEATSSPSPVRPKRTIASIFAQPIAAAEQKASSEEAGNQKGTGNLAVTPHDLSTGLTTGFSSRHTHAVPRPSLPGTWKKDDNKSNSNTALVASEASRPPRVSIVDLTGS